MKAAEIAVLDVPPVKTEGLGSRDTLLQNGAVNAVNASGDSVIVEVLKTVTVELWMAVVCFEVLGCKKVT